MQLIIKSKEETKKLAEKIAKEAKIGSVITLRGELGTGKTFFSNSFINSLYKIKNLETVEVTSPTFNIVKIYDIGDLKLYHYDLYRLKTVEEIYEIGLEDAFETGISLIEWPEIAEDIIPQNFCDISIEYGNTDEERIFNIKEYY